MKRLIIFLLVYYIANAIYAQGCYVRLADATGMDLSEDQTILTSAACELQQSFPAEYQSQFKVYDFGFYTLNEYMDGGFQAVWNNVVQDVKSRSTYYLIFGRQLYDSKGVTKLWIDLKLPPINGSPCSDKESYIMTKLNEVLNPINSPYEFSQKEVEAMELMQILKACEICDNDIDDDGDGYIDCEDLDCAIENFSFSQKPDDRLINQAFQQSTGCTVPSDTQMTCIVENLNMLTTHGCDDLESALNYCTVLITLEELVLPDPSEYEKIIEYINVVRNMTCDRCIDYELHCDFIGNWLFAIQDNPNVTTGEVYEMGLWTKMLRDEILARHLLQFGKDLLVALDIAAWEYDLFVTLRFFNAVPPSARNYGMTRMITAMQSPVSSFSSLIHAQKYGIKTFDDLGRIFKDLGWTRTAKSVEFHHLIEQRFVNVAGVPEWLGQANPNKWKCIVVAKGSAEHTPKFTTPWRNQIGYIGDNVDLITTNATLQDVQKAAKEIYKDFPEILNSLGL